MPRQTMATAVCRSANRAAPNQFLGCAESADSWGPTSSQCNSPPRESHVKATDYVGQASRRYRRNRFQTPTTLMDDAPEKADQLGRVPP
jgi:hypothetical protein